MVNAACLQVLLWGVTGLAVFLSTSVAVDYHYYGSPLIAVWNLVHYNVFAPKGSELYGVEEWPFYFINLFLNFNVVFVLSLVALPVRTLPFLNHRFSPNVMLTRSSPRVAFPGGAVVPQVVKERGPRSFCFALLLSSSLLPLARGTPPPLQSPDRLGKHSSSRP